MKISGQSHSGWLSSLCIGFQIILPFGIGHHFAFADGDEVRKFESFNGGDLTANANSGYAGGTWALGAPIDSPGYRIKVLGGYGQYAYDGSVALSGGVFPVRFVGDVMLAEVLAGYLWRRGEWTYKLYGGAQYVEHSVSPDDLTNSVRGAAWGAKGQLEVWRNLGSRNWFSGDLSYGTAFGDYRFQTRLGRRMAKRYTIGIEAGGLGNREYDAARGGGFLRIHLKNSDFTISGGATGDYLGEETSGYLSVGFYRKR